MEHEWGRAAPFLALLGAGGEQVFAEMHAGLWFVASILPVLVAALTAVTWLAETQRGSPIAFLAAVVCAGTAWLLHPSSRRA